MPRKNQDEKQAPPKTLRQMKAELSKQVSKIEQDAMAAKAPLKKQLEMVRGQIRAEEDALLQKHAGTLLLFVPEHSRTSCSDENPVNDERDCTRCQLIDIHDNGTSMDYRVDISLIREVY